MANFSFNIPLQPFFIIIIALILGSSCIEANFRRSMYYTWGISPQHSAGFLTSGGDDATLLLDQISGSGIESKKKFLFGSVEMLIKLAPGDSAGTVTAFYLSSFGEKHDEIDFEFLGNVSGEPYIIHTNIFTQGGGGREQQFYPWFDPSADYHNYTISWTPFEVVWFVDSIPIRFFRNYEPEGIPYPKKKAMRVYSSIWNADSWATRAGLDKINWSKAPFVAKLRHFRERVCTYEGPQSISFCGAQSSPYTQLNTHQQNQMKWLRSKYMVYDYCKDIKRFNGWIPGECFKPNYTDSTTLISPSHPYSS